MATKTIRAQIQYSAAQGPQSKPVDRNMLTYVQNKAKAGGGWSIADTDKFVKSGVLNDAPRGSNDEFGNVTEGNITRAMHAAQDRRVSVKLDGVPFRFTSAKSAKHFEKEMGRWYAKNAKPDRKAPTGTGTGSIAVQSPVQQSSGAIQSPAQQAS